LCEYAYFGVDNLTNQINRKGLCVQPSLHLITTPLWFDRKQLINQVNLPKPLPLHHEVIQIKIIRNASTPEDLNVISFDPIFLSRPKRVSTGYKVNEKPGTYLGR